MAQRGKGARGDYFVSALRNASARAS